MHLGLWTRSDLMPSRIRLSRFQSAPGSAHFKALQIVVLFVRENIQHCIMCISSNYRSSLRQSWREWSCTTNWSCLKSHSQHSSCAHSSTSRSPTGYCFCETYPSPCQVFSDNHSDHFTKLFVWSCSGLTLTLWWVLDILPGLTLMSLASIQFLATVTSLLSLELPWVLWRSLVNWGRWKTMSHPSWSVRQSEALHGPKESRTSIRRPMDRSCFSSPVCSKADMRSDYH